MDQRRQGCGQVDAAVMPDVRCARGASAASCARLQPWQLPAHTGDTRADQGLVAVEPEGEGASRVISGEGRRGRKSCFIARRPKMGAIPIELVMIIRGS